MDSVQIYIMEFDITHLQVIIKHTSHKIANYYQTMNQGIKSNFTFKFTFPFNGTK